MPKYRHSQCDGRPPLPITPRDSSFKFSRFHGREVVVAVWLGLLCLLFPGDRLEAQASTKDTKPESPPPAPLRVITVRDDVHLIAGDGANIVVQTGPQGVLIVDTGTGARTAEVLAAIRKLSDKPIRYIFNTSGSAEHVGGNEAMAKLGQPFGQPPGGPSAPTAPAPIVAAPGVLQKMSAMGYPRGAWPTETLLNQKLKTYYLNGQAVEVMTKGEAHSDADTVVLFRRSDVVVTGEIFDMSRFPVIDVKAGGSVQGEIAALNDLIDIAVPNTPLAWLDGGTIVVPARGRLTQQAELVEYRDMVTIIRDRVQSLIDQGKTLGQIKEARPTAGYTQRFGASSGAWTTEMFVEAVYQSLVKSREAANASNAVPRQ